ncbi:hypothetical protein [Phenylobacterium sp.]|uniref:hypothetical protein n=1 Tax=Phenylobacterium sp. TaxID=1871053 RepID=UPI002DE60286|nr:hypothetical protein [Phenylobacterium sp.]
MAQLREQDLAATAKRTRTPKQAGRTGDGQRVTVKAGDQVTEVAVSKSRYARVAAKPGVVGKVIAGYADTAAKARRTGKSYVFTFRVTPDGTAEPIAETPADDPLDAALAAAKARGQAKVTDVLKGKEMLTGRDFGSLIGASHETVNVKRKKGEVLGLEGATRGVKYPRWQVTDAGLPLPGLAELFAALGRQPWTVYRFLHTAHAELGGRTGLDALKAGQVDAVLGAARNQATGVFG